MSVVCIRIVALAVVLGAAAAGPASADPMGGGRMGGGGGGMGLGGGGGFGVGEAVGVALAAGAIATTIDDAVRRRDEAVQAGMEAGRRTRIPISEAEYDRRLNAALNKLRSRPANRGIPDDRLQDAAMEAMNKKYQIAKPERWDNDAALERARIQNREMKRINGDNLPNSSGPGGEDRNRLKQSGMNQDEHDLLHNRGAKPKGTEW